MKTLRFLLVNLLITGAAASLLLLSRPAAQIIVRRSPVFPSNFTPESLSNDLFLVYSDVGTSTTTDGAAIDIWADQSGNTRNASETGSFRPTYVANCVNSRPCVRFSGGQRISIPGNTTQSAATIVMVVKTTFVGQRAIYSNRHLSFPGGGSSLFYGLSGTQIHFAYFQQSGNQVAQFGTALGTNWMALYFVLSSDGTVELFRNNVSQGSNSGTNRSLSLPNGYIGSDSPNGEFWTGDVAFFQVVGRAITSDERTNLQNWFNARYALP